MNDGISVNNLGVPVAVDVSSIEKELSSLWKQAAEHGGEEAVVRACSCNLIAVAESSREAELMPAVLAKVSEWRPCRSIITYRETDEEGAGHAQAPHMHAWISAQCSMPFPGGPQICCEAITVSAQGQAFVDLPNTVLALLVPDLPVFLYWRSFNSHDQVLIERLARFAQLLILDSRAAKQDRLMRARMLGLLNSPPGRIAARDLNWSRLTAWRDLIAQFFDAPSLHHYAREISEVEIHHAGPAHRNVRALLLVGWLASRLGWKRVSVEKKEDQWSATWDDAGERVIVTCFGDSSHESDTSGFTTVAIKTRTDAVFTVVQEKETSHLKATALVSGSRVEHTVPVEALDEVSLIIHELSLTGEDVGYRATLAETLALEKSLS